MTIRPLIAGNWKMFGTTARASAFMVELGGALTDAVTARCDLLVCPPATQLVPSAQPLAALNVSMGGQDCAVATGDAQTGDVSAAMLADAGCSHVILGHSERRRDHGESDAVVRAKLANALDAGLTAIVCVGETEAERMAARQEAVVGAQLAGSLPDDLPAGRCVIAYEPVWAIGTGKVATPEDIAAMHAFIRRALVARFGHGATMPILYGGSVKPGNAADILSTPDVNGVLVGGASRTVADFIAIAAAA